MKEEDFRDYEYYLIETDKDGRRYMHMEGYCWQNSGRTRWDGDPNEEEYDTPYTVTEYTSVYIPLEELTALEGPGDRWEMICDAESACNQYEGDYTWDELVEAGYGDTQETNGVTGVVGFGQRLHYSDITMDTPDGAYHYLV